MSTGTLEDLMRAYMPGWYTATTTAAPGPVLHCYRCGGEQGLPAHGTLEAFEAVLAVFKKQHANCAAKPDAGAVKP